MRPPHSSGSHRHRPFQFGLRWLLMGMLVGCVVTCWVVAPRFRHFREHQLWQDYESARRTSDLAIENWRIANHHL